MNEKQKQILVGVAASAGGYLTYVATSASLTKLANVYSEKFGYSLDDSQFDLDNFLTSMGVEEERKKLLKGLLITCLILGVSTALNHVVSDYIAMKLNGGNNV